MKLFQINPETKEPELTPEARATEPFRTLSRRIKKCEGDSDGRKKILNEKEILFVYYSGNYDSNMKYADEEHRVDYLRIKLKLPNDWIPDDLVREGIQFLKESQRTDSVPIYESALNAGLAVKVWYDEIAKDIKANPKTYGPKEMIEIQRGFAMLKETLEVIRQAGEKVMSEAEQQRNRKGRLISTFEINDPEEDDRRANLNKE
jgi:hypothetical protein